MADISSFYHLLGTMGGGHPFSWPVMSNSFSGIARWGTLWSGGTSSAVGAAEPTKSIAYSPAVPIHFPPAT